MKTIRNMLASLLLAVGMGLPLLALTPAYAAPADQINSAVCATTDGPNCDNDPSESINNTIRNIIDLLSFAVGIIAVVMIIVAGIKYITSAGDAGKVTSAKNTIIYAVVGLVIVILAQVIVKFVVERTSV